MSFSLSSSYIDAGVFGTFALLLGLAFVTSVLAIPIGLIALVVAGARKLLGSRHFRPFDARWIAVFDVGAGVVLMVGTDSVVSRALGALLAIGAAGAGTAQIERLRSLLFAFLAGVGVLLAPFAALAIGISAGWRWLERHEPAV